MQKTHLTRSKTAPTGIEELLEPVYEQRRRSRTVFQNKKFNRSNPIILYDDSSDCFGVTGFYLADHYEKEGQWSWLRDSDRSAKDEDVTDSDGSLPATPQQSALVLNDDDADAAIWQEDRLGFVSFFGELFIEPALGHYES